MANQPNVEFEAAKFLHKLIQESKDEPTKLATKLYVILQHMRSSGKENSMPFQVISRAMKTVIEQHNIDIDALMSSRPPGAAGTQVGDSASSQLAGDSTAGSSQRPLAVTSTQINLPVNDVGRPDTSSRGQATPNSGGQDIYRGGPSKVQGSAPSASGSYPVIESGVPTPMAFGGSSYDNQDCAPKINNDRNMDQFFAASSVGKAVDDDGGDHTVENRVIQGGISNNAPDTSIHIRDISRDTGKSPVSGMPFKEQQLKQLRAQCLVFLSFRNGLMPKKLHLDIALGITKDDGQRRELVDHKGKEQSSLEPNNAHERPRLDTAGDTVRFTPGSSSPGMVVDTNSCKEAEISNTLEVRSGAPFQYENAEDVKHHLSSKMADSREGTISQLATLKGLQPDSSSRGLPVSNDGNNLKNTAKQIKLPIQASFIMGTGQVLKENVASHCQIEGDAHITPHANSNLPSLRQKEHLMNISRLDGQNHSTTMTKNITNESETEDEDDSVSTDWPSSANYTIVGKWILDRQKRKATFEQKLLQKQQRTEHKIAASSEKLKESVSSSEDIFAKTKSMIELKKLQLLELQRRLRSDILSDFFKPIAPEMDNLKSIKKHRIGRKSKQLERYEQRMKEERQKRIRERQKEFFAEVDVHRERLEDIFKMRRERWKGFNKYTREFHKKKERIHREKIDRIQREKINLLKINDVEGYLRMVQDTKSDRVKQLLKETEKYLQALGAKLQDAKTMARRFESEADDSRTAGTVEKTEFAAEDEDDADQAKHYLVSNEKYYMMAHSVKENIVEQPSSLVGGKLREYQMNGLRWLLSLYNNSLNGILADEMGLGKTVQVISLICYLMETKNDRGPFLVVVPSSVLPGWETEINFWAPSILRIVYSGSPDERKKLFKERIVHQKFNVLLTTYEYLMNKHDRPKLSKIHWHYIIIDEGHRIKNASCKLNADLKQYRSNHRLLLTGTPLQNNLEELWALLNFLLPDIFNSSDDFSQWFNKPFESNGDNSPDEALLSEEENLLIINRLHQVLRPFVLRRLKHKVEHELPEKIERLIRCEASAYQKLLMKRVEENLGAIGASKARTVHNSVMELRNICNHPYLSQLHVEDVHDFVPKHYLPNIVRFCGKLEMLDRLLPKLKATDHRVLLFSTMTRLLDVMEDYLCWKQYKYLRLDGHTSGGDRGALIDNFNKPGSPYFIFLLSIRAGGVGVNLQAADTVIIFDTDWNPQVDLQAQARAHRIGQKKDVLVLRLETVQTVEEQVRAAAEHKLGVANQSITAGFFDNNTSAEDRREYLESLLRESKKEEDAPVLDDDALNDRIARSISEIDIFESVDKLRLEEESVTWKQLNPGTGSEGSETVALLPPRLLTEDDLKSFYEAMKISEAAHTGVQSTGGGKRKGEYSGSLDTQHYGRGKRAREVRSYEEQWTEDDFEKLCQVDPPGSPNIDEEITDKKLPSIAVGSVVRTGENHPPVPVQSQPQPTVNPNLQEIKEVTPPPKRGRGRPRRTVAAPVTPVLSALKTPEIKTVLGSSVENTSSCSASHGSDRLPSSNPLLSMTGNSPQVACIVTNSQTTLSPASSYQSTPYSTPVQGGERDGKSGEAPKRRGKKQNLVIQDVAGAIAPSEDEKLETEKQSVTTSCYSIASEACSSSPAGVVNEQNTIPPVLIKQSVTGKVEVGPHNVPDNSSLVTPGPESLLVDPITVSAYKSIPVARAPTESEKPETKSGSVISPSSSIVPGAYSTDPDGAEKGQNVTAPVLVSQPFPVIAKVDVMGSLHLSDTSPLVGSGPESHPVGPANVNANIEYSVKNILACETASPAPPVIPDLVQGGAQSESARGRGSRGGGRVRGRGRGRGRGRKAQVGSEGSVAFEACSASASGANMTQNITPPNYVIQPSPVIGKVNVGSQNQSTVSRIVVPEPESLTTVNAMTTASTKYSAVISIPPATELPSSAPTVGPDFHFIPLQSEHKRGRGRGRKPQGRGDGSIAFDSYFTGGADKKVGVLPPIPDQSSAVIGKIDVGSQHQSEVSACLAPTTESLPAGPIVISASKEYPVIKSISASELASSIPSVIPDVAGIPSLPEAKRGRGRGRKPLVGGEGSIVSTSSTNQGGAGKEHNVIPSIPVIQSSSVIEKVVLESQHVVPILTSASNENSAVNNIPAPEFASSTPAPDSQLIPPQSEPKRGRGRGRKLQVGCEGPSPRGKRQEPVALAGVPKSTEDPKSVEHPPKRTRLSAGMKSSATLNLDKEPLNVTSIPELGASQTKSDQASGKQLGEIRQETHDGQPDISPSNTTLAVAHGSTVFSNATQLRSAPSGSPFLDVKDVASPRIDQIDSRVFPLLSANVVLKSPNLCREMGPAVSVETAVNSSAVESGNIQNEPRSKDREDNSQAENSFQAETLVISAELNTNRIPQVGVEGNTLEKEEKKPIVMSEATLKGSLNSDSQGTPGLPSSSEACILLSSSEACILDPQDQVGDVCVPLSCDKSEVEKGCEHEVPYDEVKGDASVYQAGNADIEEAVQVGISVSDTCGTLMGNSVMTKTFSKDAQRLNDSNKEMNDSGTGIQNEKISRSLDEVNDVTLESQDGRDVKENASQTTDASIDETSSSIVPSAIAISPSSESNSAIVGDLENSMNLPVEEEKVYFEKKGVDDTKTDDIHKRQASDGKMRTEVISSVLAHAAPFSDLSPTNAEAHQGLREVEETGNLDDQVNNKNAEMAGPMPNISVDDMSALAPGARITSVNYGDLFGEEGNKRQAGKDDGKREEKSLRALVTPISDLSPTSAETLQILPEEVQTSNLDKADGRFDSQVNECEEMGAEVTISLVNDTSSALPPGAGITSINSEDLSVEAGNNGGAIVEDTESSKRPPVAPILDLSATNAETHQGLREVEETCNLDDPVNNKNAEMAGPMPNISVDDMSALAPGAGITSVNYGDLFGEEGNKGQAGEDDGKREEKSLGTLVTPISDLSPTSAETLQRLPEDVQTSNLDKADDRFDSQVINECEEMGAEVTISLVNDTSSALPPGAGITSINSEDLSVEAGNNGGAIVEDTESSKRPPVAPILDLSATNAETHQGLREVEETCNLDDPVNNKNAEMAGPMPNISVDDMSALAPGAGITSVNYGDLFGEEGNKGQAGEDDGKREEKSLGTLVTPISDLSPTSAETLQRLPEDVQTSNLDKADGRFDSQVNECEEMGAELTISLVNDTSSALPSGAGITSINSEDLSGEAGNNGGAIVEDTESSMRPPFAPILDLSATNTETHQGLGEDEETYNLDIADGKLDGQVINESGESTGQVPNTLANNTSSALAPGAGIASINYVYPSCEAGNDGQEESVRCNALELDVPETIDACAEDVKDRNRDVSNASAGGTTSINSLGLCSEEGNGEQEKESVPCNALESDLPQTLAGIDIQEIESVQCNVLELDVPETIDACAEDVKDPNRDASNASAGGTTSINSGGLCSEEGSGGQEKESDPCNALESDIPETLDACTEVVKKLNWDGSDASAVGITLIDSVDLCGKTGHCGQEKESVPCDALEVDVLETVNACTEDVKDQTRDVSDASNLSSAAPVIDPTGECQAVNEDRKTDSVSNIEASSMEHVSDASNLSSAAPVIDPTGECQAVNEDQKTDSVSNVEASSMEHVSDASNLSSAAPVIDPTGECQTVNEDRKTDSVSNIEASSTEHVSDASNLSSAAPVIDPTGECQAVNEDRKTDSVSNIEASSMKHVSDSSDLSAAAPVGTAIDPSGECQAVNEDRETDAVSNIEASSVEDSLAGSAVSASD